MGIYRRAGDISRGWRCRISILCNPSMVAFVPVHGGTISRMGWEDEEKPVFEAFLKALPGFAGRPIAEWRQGANPPDVLCIDGTGSRIGVELGEWLNEAQMRANKSREHLENSYLSAVRSAELAQPDHIGVVWLGPKADVELRPENGERFRDELEKCIRKIDKAWPFRSDWGNPHFGIHRDFSSYPVVERHLDSIHLFSRKDKGPPPGYCWIRFPNRAGWYTPSDAVEALLALINDKTSKYSGLRQRENLGELYLLVYYSQGLIYNTTFEGPGFGLSEVSLIAARRVANNTGSFQKVFLFYALKPELRAVQIWPHPAEQTTST